MCACIRKTPQMLSQDDGLELQYRSCYVRILDSKRKFVEAAQRYYELSQMQNKQVSTFCGSSTQCSTGAARMYTCTYMHAISLDQDF